MTEDIYINSFLNEPQSDLYYQISIRPLEGKTSNVSIFSEFVKYETIKSRKREVRKASLVNSIKCRKRFSEIGQNISYIHGSEEMYVAFEFGGHFLISKQLIADYCKEIAEPTLVFNTVEGGFYESKLIETKYLNRVARGEFRMNILNRDNYRCRICGADPDDNAHVALEIHHIKPWAEGGITEPQNLITLCKTCHDGIKAVNRNLLYAKVGIQFPHANSKLFVQDDNFSFHSFSYITSNHIRLKIETPIGALL